MYFSQLLADLALVSGRSERVLSPLETTWQTAAPLITDMRSELVNTTPPPAPITLATSKPSPLTSFTQLDAQTVSRQIDIMSAFIDELQQVLAGRLPACPRVCGALTAVVSQSMPPQLQASLVETAASFDQDLTAWIRDLQRRSMFKLPPGDVGSHVVFPLNVFSRPEGFLDAALRHLARQRFKSLQSVHLTIDLVRCYLLMFFCSVQKFRSTQFC